MGIDQIDHGLAAMGKARAEVGRGDMWLYYRRFGPLSQRALGQAQPIAPSSQPPFEAHIIGPGPRPHAQPLQPVGHTIGGAQQGSVMNIRQTGGTVAPILEIHAGLTFLKP